MDYTIPVISMFSDGILTYGITMAITFFVLVSLIVGGCAGSFKLKASTFFAIACCSLFVASIFSMTMSGQYAYQFTKNILVLHQVSDEAKTFDVPLNPELSAIYGEFKEGQNAEGFMEEFDLYSDLSVRLEDQMDWIKSSVRGDDYADMKDFLSLCFPGESGSELYLTMGSYPPKAADLKAQADKAVESFSSMNVSTPYPAESEIPTGCVISYLVPDFL